MTTSIPSWLLAALGALALTFGTEATAVDPSQWTCESCPFESGTSGSVEVGVGAVTDKSAKFGDYTGLDRKGAFGIVGGTARYRKDGVFGNLSASDLGLDTRSLAADAGQEGRYSVRLGYSEIPHRLTDTAATPFLGAGTPVQTLPPGYPADTTAAMPLAATLQPVDIGFKRSRLDLGATVPAGATMQYRIDVRHDVRDGTQRAAGSFFSTTSQLVAPLDQVTDQVEISASYASRRLSASLAYHGSAFRNSDTSLTWQNPFTAAIAGASAGQLALAPDNEFHQLVATVGYQLTPAVRASGELAVGRMTQDAPFLAATLNPALAVPQLPAASLHGRANTLDASVRLSAAPTERLRLTASVAHNERDNQTPSLAFPTVSTDMFLGLAPRINLPYSFTRDRARLAADWRAPGTWRVSAGADYDTLHRTLQEATRTREGTVWARVGVQPRDNLRLSLKLAHAERDNTGYDPVAAIQPPENPLLRKYNEADRRRDSLAARADVTLGEGVALGLNADVANDSYTHSTIGLTTARAASFGGDFSAALSDATQLRAYVQAERIRSILANSQQFAQPDWKGRVEDRVDTVGVGATHVALKGKLELGADLSWSRSQSDNAVQVGAANAPFPTNTTSLTSLKATALWHMKEKVSLLGSLGYEDYRAADWHLDGVLPATVPNLLAFGELSPRYHVGVVRVALRYRF